MLTNIPEITSSDLKAALDFLRGDSDELAPARPPRQSTNTARGVVAVHNGINRARIRTSKQDD